MLQSQVTTLNAEDIWDNYSTSHIIVTLQKWHCSTELLREHEAKHLCLPLGSSCMALHALDMKVEHVKSCTQT